jgi:hypothetical protein
MVKTGTIPTILWRMRLGSENNSQRNNQYKKERWGCDKTNLPLANVSEVFGNGNIRC